MQIERGEREAVAQQRDDGVDRPPRQHHQQRAHQGHRAADGKRHEELVQRASSEVAGAVTGLGRAVLLAGVSGWWPASSVRSPQVRRPIGWCVR